MSKDGVSIMVMKKSGEAVASICLLWCLVLACPARAGESEDVKDGFYLGAMFAHNVMSGDFDDSIGFFSESETDMERFAAPDIDDGAGFGLVIGRRFDRISFEAGYQRTVHDSGSVLSGDNDAVYNVADLNVKIDVLARGRFRPYILLGGGIPWLTIDNGRSEDDGVTWTEEAEYRGYCLNAGIGVAYYFNPRWAVMGGLIHRWNWFNYVKGDRIDDDLLERSLGFTIGLAYTF